MQSRASAISTIAILASLALPSTALAQAPLINGLGGTVGYGEGVLLANDDGSTGIIDLSAAFPTGLEFFGTTHTSLYVNNNGNVTFAGPVGTYTPVAFPVASQPMIAAWWGDVDTRGLVAGVGQNLVYYDVAPGQFTATYYNVGYYSAHTDRLNAFQIILRDASAVGSAGDFDVEFRYNRCEWLYGDVSASTPAQGGFDAGNGVNYYEQPGSRTVAILNWCTTSNVGETGVWRYQIRSGRVAACGNAVREMGEACDDGNVVNGDGCNQRCESELPPGSGCDEDLDCRSGFCTDGVCCNARCGGQCEACNLAGAAGTCSPATGAPVGARPACAGAGTTCGGSCNGVLRAACTFPGAATACDDGAFCTAGDACNGGGACASGAPRVCTDGIACTTDVCDEALDTCTSSIGVGCLIGGACVADGTRDPANPCMACQPLLSATAYTPLASGTSCDDGMFCTTADACDGAGVCGGAARDCSDGVDCTTDTCDESADACTNFVGSTCVIGGSCFAEGVRDPSNDCLACQPSIDATSFTPLAGGTACDDGAFCTDGDACDGAGACVAGDARDCDDSDACTVDACDEDADTCTATPTTEGPGCSDAGTPDAGVDAGTDAGPDAGTDAARPELDASVGPDAQPAWEVRGSGACAVSHARSSSALAWLVAALAAVAWAVRRRGGSGQ